MARTHYQIKDETILAGLLPGTWCGDTIPTTLGRGATDETEAKKLLSEAIPFISQDTGFCEGAYTMVLLISYTRFQSHASCV